MINAPPQKKKSLISFIRLAINFASQSKASWPPPSIGRRKSSVLLVLAFANISIFSMNTIRPPFVSDTASNFDAIAATTRYRLAVQTPTTSVVGDFQFRAAICKGTHGAETPRQLFGGALVRSRRWRVVHGVQREPFLGVAVMTLLLFRLRFHVKKQAGTQEQHQRQQSNEQPKEKLGKGCVRDVGVGVVVTISIAVPHCLCRGATLYHRLRNRLQGRLQGRPQRRHHGRRKSVSGRQ
mmetsp:Transcript_42967/g.79640  ORF Transcript_42967/g.79640 Transcript_42967/m.79640 type:complete len:238 (+) Transcript_42967:210-923(+)